MGTAFEDFVNTELPRRSVLLTNAITGHDADPNVGAPAILQGAPLGAWFYEETADQWWRKKTATSSGWILWDIAAGGGGGGTNDVIRTFTLGVLLNDAVYQKSDGTVDKADASAVGTAEAFLGFVAALNSPIAGQCEIRFHGDLAGFSGLTIGETYILSTSPGLVVGLGDTINPIFPSATGTVTREVGNAASATTLFCESSRDFVEN